MKKEQNQKCDPCEQNFERKVHELVKEGKTPTHMERTKREHEVKEAFGMHADHKKEAKSHPAMAGSAKMKK